MSADMRWRESASRTLDYTESMLDLGDDWRNLAEQFVARLATADRETLRELALALAVGDSSFKSLKTQEYLWKSSADLADMVRAEEMSFQNDNE